ncbi:MAG: sugar phosphate isomerase/epimerase [Ruminococcus sp.]|nr:sugar phosphate isomerase/epimerase [Candidatus Copronaster equi]
MKLGFTLYNFNKIIETLDDLDMVLSKLEAMGVNLVQVSGIGQLSNYDIAELCKKHNMEVCVTHTPLDRIINETDEVIKEHKALGCDTIGVGWVDFKYHSAQGVQDFTKTMTPVCEKIKAAGMKFAYHNHQFEFERYENGKTFMDSLIEADPELFNFILDIHWLQTGGVNPAEYIRKVQGRMKVCHFKDYRIINVDDNYEPDFAEIGTGNINLDECYRACKETGVECIIIEQDRTKLDLFESAEISWKNLNKIAERN